MNTDRRTSITISIIIRRIFAIFLFTSIASGIITDFLYGNITSDSVFGAIVGLVIVFFLFRRPRKFKTVSNEEVKGNTVEEDKDFAGMSSFLPPRPAYEVLTEETIVNTITFEKIFEFTGFTQIDYLKIDVEEYDLELFASKQHTKPSVTICGPYAKLLAIFSVLIYTFIWFYF